MNNTGGKATFKGVNAQSWAALSLFLQYVRTSNLDHIAFEQDKLKDFDLVFSNKRKIICESKTTKITHALLREILTKLIDNDKVEENDEILIICQEVSPAVESDVENLKYYEHLKEEIKKKGFTDKHINLISKVKFWKIDQDKNQLIVNSLLSEILGAWVPDKTFNEIVSDILIDKVYKGSASGGILTRKDFYQMIDDRKKQIQSDAGYEDEQNEKIARIDEVLTAIKNPTRRAWCNDQISLLTTTPDLYYLTVKKLEGIPDLKLADWDNLWKATSRGTFSLNIFDIFQKNVNDSENQKYLINFLPTILNNLISFYRQEFFVVDIVKICSAIIGQNRSYDNDVFDILKSLLEASSKDYFYVERWHDRKEWEQENITEALKTLYENTDEGTKEKITGFIFGFFDLVEDDGQFWHYTPNAIFEILRFYVQGNVENRILSLSKTLSEQYLTFYKRFGRKSIYKGWEHIGFTDTDRHFLTYILQPVLTEYYSTNPEGAWEFITKKLITKKESEVSEDRPDYLNRAAIPIILDVYKNPNHSDEALDILKGFVEMKKGIPHKTEIIYKYVLGSSLTDEQKWTLVNLQLSYKPYKGLPANHIVEKIVSELANNGHQEAIEILDSWATNPEYNKFRGIHEGNITKTVPGLLVNPKTKTRGVTLLKKFLDSDFFIEKQGLWDVWGTAKVLTNVLVEEFDEGASIIEKIWGQDSLSKSQQVLITNSINGLDKNDDLVIRTYDQVVSKWLDDCKDDLDVLIQKIPDIQSRTSIVQFGEKLAKARRYDAALRIAKIFINDPDPTNESDPDDPEGKHNYHELVKNGKDVNQITTIRTWVAWLLQSIAVLRGRDYIPEVIPLVEKLTTDPNYYVRAYSCIPLEQLAKVRHTVLPQDKNTRFLDIKYAEQIESIAYAMLRNKENLPLEQVMMGVLRIFTNIRSVTTEEAKEILLTLLETKNNKVIEEARVLFIFFAEYRANSINEDNLIHVFTKERIAQLKTFDDQYFKVLLIKVLTDYPSEVKAGFAWAFWHLPKEEGAKFEEAFSIAYKYLSILVKSYEHEVMTNIYYFIEEFIGQKFDECFDLWKQCLSVERPFLKEKITKENFYDMHWWPYHYNGKMLFKIFEIRGEDEFLRWLDYLTDYPEGIIIASDLSIAIDKLIQLSVTLRSKEIFKKIVVRNPEYFEKMKAWSVNGN